MSYRLPTKASLETLMSYVGSVSAALLAKPETSALADPWLAMRTTLRQARDGRDDDVWALEAVQARMRVLDNDWDRAVVAVSGEAFALAGKRAEAEPYVSLFGGMDAQTATRLGAYKAAAFGERLVLKAKEMKHARLTEPCVLLEDLNGKLQTVDGERSAAEDRISLHGTRRRVLLRGVEELIARTEVQLLELFPGRRDIVRAVLAPPRNKPSRASGEAKPERTEIEPSDA